MNPSIREALEDDRKPLSGCLSRAFEDDPVSRFLFPHDGSRLRRLVAFYGRVLPVMAQQGVIYTDEALRGAAVWRSPSAPESGGLRALRDALQMLVALRGAIGRAFQLDQIVVQARPTVPHWYLAILGTEPSSQGRGVGSALLAPVLARCDGDGLPAYLESSKLENIPFYERHGFRVKEELRVQEGPTLWSMVREPRVLNPGRDPAE